MRPPLTGLVAKGYDTHKHAWKRVERRVGDAVFSLHVCTDHDKPVVKVYDVRKTVSAAITEALQQDQEVMQRRGKQRARTN